MCHRHDTSQTERRPLLARLLLLLSPTTVTVCATASFQLALILSAVLLPSPCTALPQPGGEGGAFKRPVITRPPSDVYSVDGVLEFTCQAEGQPKPVIQWYDAQTRQPVVDRVPTGGMTWGIHVNQHYGRLLISNPTKNHVYSFYCNASNAVGWVSSQPPVRGGLAYLESAFRQVPQDTTAYRHEQAMLNCEPPVGVPQARVLWFQDDQLVATSDNSSSAEAGRQPLGKAVRVVGRGSLLIEKVDSVHAGAYVCVAVNTAGQVRSPAVRVTVAPRIRFLETPSDVRVRKGMTAEFRCRVDGKPLMQWSRKPGEGSIDANRAELTENHLLVKNVQPSDAGTYVCSVPGFITATAVLIVETPPVFHQTPEDLKLPVGSDAVFQCATTGYPKPSIYWELPDKTPIFPSEYSSKGRYYVHPDGRFNIRNVQLSDAGKYQCTAHSSIDRIHSSAHLEILPTDTAQNHVILGKHAGVGKNKQPPQKPGSLHHLPVLYPPAPVIGLPPMNQTRAVGDLVTLDCELSGVQEHEADYASAYTVFTTVEQSVQQQYASSLGLSPAEWPVSWYRTTLATGNLLERIDFSAHDGDHRFRLLPGGSLQIVDIQLGDTGIYTCSAKAIVGRARVNEHDSMLLQQSNWTAQLIVVSHRSPLASDLRAENPLSPPRHLRATNLTDTMVTLNWEDSDPGTLVGLTGGVQPALKVVYWVDFYRADRPLDGWITVERNWPANWVQIGGLQPNTGYYFLIRPRYETGRLGWASPPIGPLFTLQKPATDTANEPRQTGSLTESKQIARDIKYLHIGTVDVYPLSPNKLRISWTLSDRPLILSMITGYRIHYQPVSLFQCLPTTQAGHDKTFDKVGWQTRLGDNYCSLRMPLNSDIVMLYQRVQELQTLRSEAFLAEATKSAYRSTTVSQNVSAKSITVEVDQFQQLTYPEDSQSVVYHGQGVITDLEPFHCYSVSVQPFAKLAAFENIDGRETARSSVLTYESFPSLPPTHVSARWRTAEELELSWLPPPVAHWNGLLTGYIIYAYDDTGRNHQTFNITVHERMTRMTGLGGPQVILVQMAAVNCHGVGLRSEPLQLEPQYKKQGFGAGWGFDPRDGTLLARNETLENNEFPSSLSSSTQFYRRPWFLVVIVIGVLLWSTFLVLIIYLCRRQKYALRKGAAGVLITNSSQCDPSSNNQLDAAYSDRRAKERNALQLEPLLCQQSGTANLPESEANFVNISQAVYTGGELLPTPARYTAYSVATNAKDFGKRTNHLIVGNGTTRRSLNPGGYSAGTVNHFLEPTSNVYATTGPEMVSDHVSSTVSGVLSACHQASLFTSIPNNNHNHNYNRVNFQPVTTILTSNCTGLPVGFLPAQSSVMLQASESMTDFTIHQVTRPSIDQSMIAISDRPAVGGLPPIAPVARLGVEDTAYRVKSFAPIADQAICCPVSVAPYATASIIQNSGIDENKGYLTQSLHPRPCLSRPMARDLGCGMDCSQRSGTLYTLEVLPCQSDSTIGTGASADDHQRRSVSKTQSDGTSGRLNQDLVTNGGNVVVHEASLNSGSHASPLGLHQGSTEEHSSSRSSSNVGTSAAPMSRSGWCGGNAMLNRMMAVSCRDEETSAACVHYSGANESNSSGASSNHTGGSYAGQINGNVWTSRSSNMPCEEKPTTFFSESYIPPPPKSPPPPAPKSLADRECSRQSMVLLGGRHTQGMPSRDEEYYQLSEHSSSILSCSRVNSQSEFEASPLLADRTATSAVQYDEDLQQIRQCRQADQGAQPDRFMSIQTVMPNRFPGQKSLDIRCEIAGESPYCVSAPNDDPHNSTYAQVY